MRRRIPAVLLGVFLAACGGGGDSPPTTEPPPPPPVVTRVDVTPNTGTLNVGASQALSAAAFDAAGAAITGRAVTWRSDAPAVATVTDAGVVTAVAAGAAPIVATISGVSGTSNITVNAVVARVDVTPSTITLNVGATQTLTATAFDAAGAPITGRAVTWRSDAPSVATVTTAGVVTAVAPGTAPAPIVATISGVSGTSNITVRDVLVIAADSVRLDGTGLNADLRATRNGVPVTTLTTTLIDDQRWLSEVAVLDAAALAQGRVTSVGPGRARVRVQLGTLVDTVIIGVTLPRARVYTVTVPSGKTHLGTGDTIALRGYALTSLAVSALQANGFTPTTTTRDSANWRVVVSSAAAACTGSPAAITLTLTGSDGTFPTNLTRAFANELSLDVGEAKRLTDAEAACLRFSPSSTARHLLAYADSRLHTKAQTMAEFPWPDSIIARVTPAGVNPVLDAPNATAAIATSAIAGRSAGRIVRDPAREESFNASFAVIRPPVLVVPVAAASIPSGCPFLNAYAPHCRSTPYAIGDVFTHYPSGRTPGPARVIAIRGNLVLAIFREDSTLLPSVAIPRADSALKLFAEQGVPWLQHVYSLSAPTTSSDESGQLLLMLDASPGSSAGWYAEATGHGRWGRLTLGLPDGSGFRTLGTSYSLNFSIIAHEVTHTYQFRWRYEYAGPWQTYLGTSWGIEGGATFAQLQTLREALGISFSSNTNFDVLPLSDPAGSLSVGARATGDMTAGYVPASSMLRDFMQRLVQSGMTTRDAAREVAKGAMEGWYGINEEGQARGLGLTARMRARLGASWNPTDAMLQWTMSEAADDMTANATYQNVSNKKFAQTTQAASLPPHSPLVQPTIAAAVKRTAGNNGVFEIADGVGTAFRADATVAGASSPALEWLVMRIK